jgi:exopolyphosphatase/guanosine-5'-triphosphate,3'-diphosphate pyrophosphatase
MRKAALDIGSNSIILLIADLDDGKISKLGEWFFEPRLGDGALASGSLKPERMAEAMAAIGQAWEICQQHDVTELKAVATAAIREASNGQEFAQQVFDEFAIRVDLISGEEEARLTYLGAVSAFDLPETAAVLDVGGGSSELVIGKGQEIESRISIPQGAVKLMEEFGKSPLAEAELFLAEEMKPLCADLNGQRLIGVGGSITTLAAMELGLEEYDDKKIAQVSFSLIELGKWRLRLQKMSVAEIANLPGIEPRRADIIESGLAIIWSIMKQSDIKKIYVSPRGLRYALLS